MSGTSAGSSPITISFKNHNKMSPTQSNEAPSAEGMSRVRRPHAAFATDEEDTPTPTPTPTHHHTPTPTATPNHKGKEKKDKVKKGEGGQGDKEKDSKSAEEKRKHIKSLIDKIPTQKEQLFQYKLDTSQIDSVLMEKKIRPWINKKIVEYIGEPEPTLVDFICSKVLAGSAPQGVLDDVQMVLDEEAEVFVVKMWRLLIYELEAKKAGLHNTK